MSRARVRSRTVALAIVCELIVGAVIWFSSAPSEAQPAAEAPAQVADDGSVPTAPADGSASVPSGANTASATAAGTPSPASAAPSPDAQPSTGACPAGKPHKSKPFIEIVKRDLVPIGILIVVIAIVIVRLPKVELGHSTAFRRRRLLNWLPLGLTYTFLYFGRYNIKSFQDVGLTADEFGTVFGVGSAVYGLAFLLNGPLTDRWGGRATILISAAGAGLANLWMGYMAATGNTFGMSVPTAFTVAFAINMYFQSFGAVSIVKVNAAWFHMRERGTFGGIFGILISLGLYFAYDVIGRIKDAFAIQWIFLVPAMVLFVFFLLSFVFVRNEPADTGHANFDLGDATQAEDEGTAKMSWGQWLRQIGVVLKKLLSHPVILTIAAIELCSGFLRQSILQWGIDFGKGIGVGNTFVFQNWGMVACVAGITGGMFAGAISDHVFQSRRSPVAGVLYAIMLAGAVLILVLMSTPQTIGWIVAFMSMAIIGVHGMLTATASADFAGKHNTGVAVGMIDGFVYLGSTVQSFIYGAVLPAAKIRDKAGCLVPNPEASNLDNWHVWPITMIPVAVVGLLLTLRIWNAKPRKDAPPAH
jgi:OPA family glycerol-3-phosphate transporter-like MFS transporter